MSRLFPHGLCLMLLGLLTACGGEGGGTEAPAQDVDVVATPSGPAQNRVVVIGFDGVDPDWVEEWKDELPNITALLGDGPVPRLGTTTPPQSPVAWTSFATSLNPGGHGIFDFVTRDPKTYFPAVGTNTYTEARFDAAGKLIRKAMATSPRAGTPFWKVAADAGERVRVLFVPYSFPPDELKNGSVLSGLGTPDLRLTNSTFTLLSSSATEAEAKKDVAGGDIVRLTGDGTTYKGVVSGPKGITKKRETLDVTVTKGNEGMVTIQIGDAKTVVKAGSFSDWVTVEFPISNWYVAKALVRFYPFEVGQNVQVYMYPLLVHPDEPYIEISSPTDFAASLKTEHGTFKTIGWEHDTSALNSNLVPDEVFVADRAGIFERRLTMTLGELKKNDAELFISVFTDTDRASHMFLRLTDESHPSYDAKLAERYGGFIKQTYLDMDGAIGQIRDALNPGDRLILLSDHGFHSFKRGFNTNTWLLENGYLTLGPGKQRARTNSVLRGDVDWSKTQAYAYGTGQIYLNIKGRERDGIVDPATATALGREISDKLKTVKDGANPVLSNAYVGTEIYTGAMVAARAPDLQLAFHEGYQSSRATSLGGMPLGLFSDNKKKWSGDHAASDAADTEGFLLSSEGALGPDPSILDIGPTVLNWLGVAVPDEFEGKALKVVASSQEANDG